MNLELTAKLKQIMAWSKARYSLTRFGVAKTSVLDSYNSRPVKLEYPDPSSIGPPEMDSEQIFPFRDSLLITLAQVTAASTTDHGVTSIGTLCWGRFLASSYIYDASRYRVPGQTLQMISMMTGRITTRPKLPIDEPCYIILDAWLDRMGTTEVQQLEEQAEAEQLFAEQVNQTIGCSCGIMLKLLLDLQGNQLLNLALWAETDQIL